MPGTGGIVETQQGGEQRGFQTHGAGCAHVYERMIKAFKMRDRIEIIGLAMCVNGRGVALERVS